MTGWSFADIRRMPISHLSAVLGVNDKKHGGKRRATTAEEIKAAAQMMGWTG